MSFRLTDTYSSFPFKLEPIAWHMVLGLILLAWCVPALADAPADMDAYCVDKFGSGTISGFDRRNNAPLCSERTSNGLGLLHHIVDPAAVCTAQHQTSQFRKEGPKVICLTTSTGQSSGSEKIDLTTYCTSTYGQSAIVSRRLTDNRPLCTVKGSGGLSQTHYLIDTAELCGGGAVSPDAVEGNVLNCTGTNAQASTQPAKQAPSGNQARKNSGSGHSDEKAKTPPRSISTATVPDTAIVSIDDEPDLTGCGVPAAPELRDLGYEKEYEAAHQLILDQSKLVALYDNFGQKSEAEQRAVLEKYRASPVHWKGGSVPRPCPALSDGFVLDLHEVCRTHYANPEPNFLFWLPSGRPVCHPSDWSSQVPSQSDIDSVATFSLSLYSACIDMFPDRSAIRFLQPDDPPDKVPGSLYPILKFSGRTAECFYLDIAQIHEYTIHQE